MTKHELITLGVLIDPEDEYLLDKYNWYLYTQNQHTSYVFKCYPKESLHRVIMGDKCIGLEVDHINGNTLDNRRVNLRTVTRTENGQNYRFLHPTNTSGVSGVWWSKPRRPGQEGYWRTNIWIGGRKARKKINLGNFQNLEDAAKAVHEARLIHMPGYVAAPTEKRSA